MGSGRVTTTKFQSAPNQEAQPSMFQRRPFADDITSAESEESSSSLQVSAPPATTTPTPIHIPLFAPTASPPAIQQTEDSASEEEFQEDDLLLQTKLTIGQPNDKYEQEADAVASQVMAMPEASVQTQSNKLSEDETHDLKRRGAIAPPLQPQSINHNPKSNKVSSLTQRKPHLQTKGDGKSAPPDFEKRLNQRKGNGKPLPDDVKSFMEPRFNADFSGVKVYEAPKEAGAIGAQAFTHGQDIYFNSGKYNPGSSSGKELLAHELTHTIQQTGGVQAKGDRSTLEQPKALPIQRLCSKCDKEKKLQTKLNSNSLESALEPQAESTPVLEKTVDLLTASQTSSTTQQSFTPSPSPRSTQASFTTTQTPEQELQGGTTEELVASNQPPTKPKNDLESPGNQSPETNVLSSTPSAIADGDAQQVQMEMASKLQDAPERLTSQLYLEQSAQANQTGGLSTNALTQGGSASGSLVIGAAQNISLEVADEESEAEVMRQQLEAASENATPAGDSLLSPVEQNVARTALLNAPAPSSSGGGGGGGGVAIPDKPVPSPPNVSQADPSSAIATIANLPPAQLHAALGGVSAAVTNTVGKEQENLAANPLQAETLDGREGAASAKDVPGGQTPQPVEVQPEGADVPVQKPAALPSPPPAPQPPVPTPAVQNTESGTLSESGANQIQTSIRHLPTQDAGAPSTSAGEPPALALEGSANPQNTEAQKASLDTSLTETKAQGQQEALTPMGEGEVYATLPKETLQASVAQSSAGLGGNTNAAGTMAETLEGMEAASVVAQEEHGAEIQAAIAQAQGDLAAKKGEHETTVAEEQSRSNEEISHLKQENIQQQDAERARVQEEVGQLRADWQGEQDTEIASARAKADQEMSQGLSEVEAEKINAEGKATQEIQKGEENAEQERVKGEQEAEAARQKGEQESGGILGWAADAAKSFFEGIKNAIKAAFDKARQAIRAAIDKAKELATAVIEAGRQAIVGIIRRVGDALIAIGDTLLAKFPELRDKYRGFIQDAVKVAEDTVNTLAEGLKTGIQAALDLYAKGLEAALSVYEKGMMLAVDAVSAVVDNVLATAQSAIQAFGAFAAVAPDIAANPGQWVSNFGGAVEGGVEGPTLWGAFKAKTEEWFDGKVQQVTTLAPEQVDNLDEGGFGLREIARMVWDNIVQAIPGILIGILLEKVVSMLIPAVGAVLTVLQSLQAAWGTVSQILAAFSLFVGFLLAVKTGNAAPLFAGLLAAAGIVLLDFIAQWLLKKLVQAAKAIAGRLKGMADNLKEKHQAKDGDEHSTPTDTNDGKKKISDSEESLEQSDTTKQKRNNQDVERDKAAEEDLPNGHKVKVTNDGDIYTCTACEVTTLPKEKQDEVDKAKTPEEKAAIVREYVYVHEDDDGGVNYIGITDNPSRRSGEHSRDSEKTGSTMRVISEPVSHDEARTIEGTLIRQRLVEASAEGLITGTEPIAEQLEKAGLLNRNRGREQSRWVNIDIDDYLIDDGKTFSLKDLREKQ